MAQDLLAIPAFIMDREFLLLYADETAAFIHQFIQDYKETEKEIARVQQITQQITSSSGIISSSNTDSETFTNQI